MQPLLTRRRRSLALLLFALWLMIHSLSVSPRVVSAEEQPVATAVVRIEYRDRAELQWLADRDYDIWAVELAPRVATVLVTPAQWQELSRAGYKFTTDTRRSSDLEEASTSAFYGGYATVDELYALYDDVAARYPHLAQLVDYGDSWVKVTSGGAAGDDLKVMRLTNRAITGSTPAPGLPYRPVIVISKPVFLLIGNVHARELSTTEMPRRFLEMMVQGYGVDPDITWLLDHQEIWIILTANPDGYRIVEGDGVFPVLQRKNANSTLGRCEVPAIGVDLNRNGSFKWNMGGSSAFPCAQIYHGTGPASEPEQQALETLMAGLFADQRGPGDLDAAPLDTPGVMISLHSYSDLVLWPWGWTDGMAAPNHAQLAQLGIKMATYNGYTAAQAGPGIYVASGTTDDWAYGVLGVAAYTFEIGPADGLCAGFFPPFGCQDQFWELNRPALLYAARSARAPYLLPAGPDVLGPVLSSSRVEVGEAVTLTARIDDTSTGNLPVAGASYWIEVPPWSEGAAALPMTAADGVFDSPVEVASGTIDTSGLAPGRYTVYVQGEDSAGNWGPPSAVFIVVAPADQHERQYLPLLNQIASSRN
jgi:hypothetical protein